MNHTVGTYWLSGCWEYTIPAGQTVCGIVFHVKNVTGDCDIKRMSWNEAGCTEPGLFGNNSSGDCADEGWYFAVNPDYIDEVECLARLAPGATVRTNVYRRDGPDDISAGWHMGFTCTGYADIHVAWVVFEGTSP